MKYFLQVLLKNLPFILFIVLIIFVQLLLIQINIVGILLFAQILLKHDTYRAIIIAVLASLLIDSVKMNPIGLWAFTFFASALIIAIIARLIKINEDIHTISKISLIPLILLISLGATLQTYIMSQLEGHQTFDFTVSYSIVCISTLYTLFVKITARPDKLALPHV